MISEIHIALPVHITSAKLLTVHIESKRLRILENGPGAAVLLEGDLFSNCKHTSAMWSLSHRKLQISLDKSSEVWWRQLFVTEPTLDLKRIDCSRPNDELSEDTQAAISKLQWDEHQKRLGMCVLILFVILLYFANLWLALTQVIRHRMKSNSMKCYAKHGTRTGHRLKAHRFHRTQ